MNVTLFAFGATNSGKTYSLEGSNADAGLISLFVDSLFTNLDLKAKNVKIVKFWINEIEFVNLGECWWKIWFYNSSLYFSSENEIL